MLWFIQLFPHLGAFTLFLVFRSYSSVMNKSVCKYVLIATDYFFWLDYWKWNNWWKAINIFSVYIHYVYICGCIYIYLYIYTHIYIHICCIYIIQCIYNVCIEYILYILYTYIEYIWYIFYIFLSLSRNVLIYLICVISFLLQGTLCVCV